MTTDWWNAEPAKEPASGLPCPTPTPTSPEPPNGGTPSPSGPEGSEEREGPQSGPSRAQRRAAKILGVAAGAVIAGTFILGSASGEEEGPKGASAPVAVEQEGDLPPAGGTFPQGNPPVAEKGPATGGRGEEGAPTQEQAPARQSVTLTAVPSGEKGRVGVIVKVTIHNGTDKPLTVLATLMKGDGRSAVVGEGTLAPGSRTVEPGETVEGTVEFATSEAPRQVSLHDLSGNVVAAS